MQVDFVSRTAGVITLCEKGIALPREMRNAAKSASEDRTYRRCPHCDVLCDAVTPGISCPNRLCLSITAGDVEMEERNGPAELNSMKVWNSGLVWSSLVWSSLV